MIAFLLPTLEFARVVGAHFRSATEEVDGPFRLVEGRLGGSMARAFAVTGNADAAYAATLLAQRRGAQAVIAVSMAWTTEGIRKELAIPTDRMLPVGEVRDLSALATGLALLPDSALDFSMLPAELSAPIWKSDDHDSPALVGTFPWPVLNPWLLRELQRRTGIVLGDVQLAGAAMAARERDLRFVPMVFVAETLSRTSVARANRLEFDTAFEASAAELLAPWQDT